MIKHGVHKFLSSEIILVKIGKCLVIDGLFCVVFTFLSYILPSNAYDPRLPHSPRVLVAWLQMCLKFPTSLHHQPVKSRHLFAPIQGKNCIYHIFSGLDQFVKGTWLSVGRQGKGCIFWSERSACAVLRRCCGTKCPLYCQAQPKLQVQLEAQLALISLYPSTPIPPPPTPAWES